MYKRQLQELAQRSCFNLPAYTCVREGPDDAPRFKVAVTFNGEQFESPGFFTTIRQGEHAAAEVALAALARRGPSYSLANRILPVDFVTNIEAADRQGNHTSSQLGKVSETSRQDGHRKYSELTTKFKRQQIDKDAWRIFSNEDYSDTRNQDSDSLARVEKQHYTLCKDVNAWLALVKQCQKGGLYHTCMQQAPRQLLGRDDIKQRIAEKMLGSNGESNCTVICIVAGSGLGKTSLLRVLHNDQQLLDAFDKRICIQMSDKFDKLMLFRNIIEYAMREHCSITNLSFLEEMVKEELADKKFLLFLDDADIEDQHFWTSALEILNAGVKGSAVVIATRSTTVADFTAGALHSYYLDALSEESNLMLLQQYACMGQDIHVRDICIVCYSPLL